MSLQTVPTNGFSFFSKKPVVVETTELRLTSDAGLLPFRELDQQLGFTAGFAQALRDSRRAASVTHSTLEMVRSRVFGILAGYSDQNDHDTLRFDALFQLIADRVPGEEPLASQPTLSRFETAITPGDLFRLRKELVDQFIASFAEPPSRLLFDLDAFDDATHGQQQLTLFHGFYGQYQYLPLVITSADKDVVVAICLRHGTAKASLGAGDDLRYLVHRLRAVWPDVVIELRADSGFGVPEMYEDCEELGLIYSFGYQMNSVIKERTADLLEQAISQHEAAVKALEDRGELVTHENTKQRLFTGFWYQAGTWDRARWVVVKVEAHLKGTNRRAVVTNRPGAPILPQGAYDDYVRRGESENRNKELKVSLEADRLSDHRVLANAFRLQLHVLAYNLLVRMRQLVADPPEVAGELERQALPEAERRRYANARRRCDPLGEGHAETWRTRVIKVAAEIVIRARHIRIRLSETWAHLNHYQSVCQAVLAAAPS